MAVDARTKAAWTKCPFCSQSNSAIKSIIRDRSRWNELPVEYACAWKRICQVAWGGQIMRYEKAIWSDLCSHRSEVNNQPSYSWDEPAYWTEGYCKTYGETAPSPQEQMTAWLAEALEPGKWRAGFRLQNLIITQVVKDTPAHTAGLMPGDRVVLICDQHVEDDGDVYGLQAAVKRGDPMPVVVERNGDRVVLEINRPSKRTRRIG